MRKEPPVPLSEVRGPFVKDVGRGLLLYTAVGEVGLPPQQLCDSEEESQSAGFKSHNAPELWGLQQAT